MRPVNRDIDLEELFAGSTDVIGRDALEKKIRAGQRLVVKHGVDPTARDLHLGYAVNYQAMRRFQDAGHTVVLLIGDYTSRIGDPTGKDKTRPQLTDAQIEANIESMLTQVDRVLDTEHLVIRRNSEWLGDMSLLDFLKLGTRISAARLWERDMFQRRLEKSLPVYVHEFLYPVLQGYDSYALNADITINGSDQQFNELMGREIQQLFGQDPQAIMIMPMLVGTDGTPLTSTPIPVAGGLGPSQGPALGLSGGLGLVWPRVRAEVRGSYWLPSRAVAPERSEVGAKLTLAAGAARAGPRWAWDTLSLALLGGVELGAFCMVGMASVVTRNVPAHALVVGNPARVVGVVCACGEVVARGDKPANGKYSCRCGRVVMFAP